MLNIKNLTYSYSKKAKPVLLDLSLSLEPGTICGLLGKNGAGKSTLLYLIAGLLKPQSGTIDYNCCTPWNRDIDFLKDIFIVPEEFKLPDVSLMSFINSTAPFYPNFSYEHLEKHLATFELSPDVHLGKLSMGQKKRVFISFALACNTSLILLDEPTNGLDIPGKRLFRKALLNGMTDNSTIIISTHQVYDVEKIIDHAIITDNSGLLLNASTAAITSALRFRHTTDRNLADKALVALEAPGGYNIVERLESPDEETDINLESLFELAQKSPLLLQQIIRENNNSLINS